VALERVLVHVPATDAPPVGQDLSHAELGPESAVDAVEERGGERSGPSPGIGGQGHPAHHLHPAGHHHVVVAGTCWGSPAATQALRVTLVPCSPTWVTQPPMTSSTCSGSTPVRSTNDERANPRRSAGCQWASAPPRLPSVVRTTSTTTASRPSSLMASPHRSVSPTPKCLHPVHRCRRPRRHRPPYGPGRARRPPPVRRVRPAPPPPRTTRWPPGRRRPPCRARAPPPSTRCPEPGRPAARPGGVP